MGLFPGLETLLQHMSIHLLVHGATQHKQLTFATIVKSSPIRWQMDRHYQLFPAHRHQRASQPAAYSSELVHLCDATWILTRQWGYSVASGRCPKHEIRWWRQTWDTAPYFTVVNQSEARISTEHGIILVTPCLLTRIREFIHTQHRNTTRGRRPRVVLRC